jgi:hypothetical protein
MKTTGPAWAGFMNCETRLPPYQGNIPVHETGFMCSTIKNIKHELSSLPTIS